MEMLNNINVKVPGSHYIQHILSLKNSSPSRTSELERKPPLLGSSNPNELDSQLSVRELEVAKLVMEGYRNKEIANKLYVSEVTIKKHLYNTYKKLGVNNRINMVQKAKELEIIGNA